MNKATNSKAARAQRLLSISNQEWNTFVAVKKLHGAVDPRTKLAFSNFRVFRDMLDRL